MDLEMTIPFNQPYVSRKSLEYVYQVLTSDHQQGDGPYTNAASKIISKIVGGGKVLLTPSCTHALELATMLGDFKPGDEVILPSFTFTSGATALTKFGITPVFIDSSIIDNNIDIDLIERLINEKTKAISWVNYAGNPPNIEKLLQIASDYKLMLIEDNAHGLGGSYMGKPLGSFGDVSTLSFHATKNVQCGEGGALVINNLKYLERAEIIREKGTNRSRYIRGDVQKYQWVDHGSSYLMAEPLAGILLGQLEDFEKIQESRLSIWMKYDVAFRNLRGFTPDPSRKFSKSNLVAHIYYLMAETATIREDFQAYMKKAEIGTAFHYQSLHNSPAGKKFGTTPYPIEKAQIISNQLVRLPVYPGLTEEKILNVIGAVLEFDRALS